MNADDFLRAETLFWKYLEEGVADELKQELTALVDEGRKKAEVTSRRAVVAPGARFTFHKAA